jgi:4-carboxymuconolactone decarboxylase
MSPPQRDAAAEFLRTRGVPVFGPFVPLLRSPELMINAKLMGDHLRYRSTLAPHLSEFVILLVAREWNSPVEWAIHQPTALAAGLSTAKIDAIANRRRPTELTPEEEIAYDLFHELTAKRAISDKTYEQAALLLGEQGLVDLIGICGYYTLLAMVMNTARTAPAQHANSLPDPAYESQ